MWALYRKNAWRGTYREITNVFFKSLCNAVDLVVWDVYRENGAGSIQGSDVGLIQEKYRQAGRKTKSTIDRSSEIATDASRQ